MKAIKPTTPTEAIHARITDTLSRPIIDRDEMADALIASLGLHTEYAGEGIGCNEDGDYPALYTVRAASVELYPRD